MAKRNTDTVKAMLTPGEFVIKKESAKKIGYDKLNQMNKTGKVNNKEAKMPQGKGTYGKQVGRPSKSKKMQYGGVVPGGRGVRRPGRFNRRPSLSPMGRAGASRGRMSGPIGASPPRIGPPRSLAPRMRPGRGYSKGGKVTSGGYSVVGESDGYKAGK